MANVGNQKQKLLYIMEIFLRETDEEHPITAAQIIEKLEAREIVAERKSIYRDIRALQDYGMDIEKAPEQNGFYLAERQSSSQRKSRANWCKRSNIWEAPIRADTFTVRSLCRIVSKWQTSVSTTRSTRSISVLIITVK